ncbi:MAG: NAD(P)H-dependent glycerol-3-phosphate dehydrogenase [Thermoanaerobaculia bacterium]
MKIVVLGAGAWGTALSALSLRSGHETFLWTRDPDTAASIRAERRHPRRLSNFELPEGLSAESDPGCARGADVVILAVPSSATRETLRTFVGIASEPVWVSAIKGFEMETGKTVSRILQETVPGARIAVISGPTFADGLMRGDPTAAVIASESAEIARGLQEELSGPVFRLYASEDVVGVELCGGLKNVIAIAGGIVSGLGLGHNTLAAVMTRGLAEIRRLVLARGGREGTLLGLAGAGDLMLTCTGSQSRNRRVGEDIGRGTPADVAMARSSEVAEGTRACVAAVAMAAESSVEMPIAEAVRGVLYGGVSPRDAIRALMTRDLRSE